MNLIHLISKHIHDRRTIEQCHGAICHNLPTLIYSYYSHANYEARVCPLDNFGNRSFETMYAIPSMPRAISGTDQDIFGNVYVCVCVGGGGEYNKIYRKIEVPHPSIDDELPNFPPKKH